MIPVYLEEGQSRIFVVVPQWPGWCRCGRTEETALQVLLAYAPRYAQVLSETPLAFHPPASLSDLQVVGRLSGNSTTDFGAPDLVLLTDVLPVVAAELERMQILLKAAWCAFDKAVASAQGRSLRKGPRGGGRDLEKMIAHVREAEAAYLAKLGGKLPSDRTDEQSRRDAILATLSASSRGEVPAFGPRGGARWTPRYFVRRIAWHVLDHAWEIEDRLE